MGILIPQFPGQTHMFFWREIKALEDRGIDVQVFSTRMPAAGLISHAWSDEAIARTIYLGKVDPLEALRGLFSVPLSFWKADVQREGRTLLKDLAISMSAARALMHDCAALGIEHVHVHSCGRAALVAALSKKMGGPDYSVTLHGPMTDYGVGQRLKWRHAAFATIITEKLLAEVKRDLAGDLPERLLIQAMGVDTENLKRDTPYEPADPDSEIRLFSCGRLNIVKGHQDLMEAVALLRSKGLNVKLEIAGNDDDGGAGFRKTLDQKIIELGMSDHITLLGAISADAVKERIINAHTFALASWHEPLGVAYMEAMSCGVPVIGTMSGGLPELLTHGKDGLMVPPKDPAALADAIEGLVRDPAQAQALAEAGRARVVSAFRSDLGAETLIREVFGSK